MNSCLVTSASKIIVNLTDSYQLSTGRLHLIKQN